MSIYDIQINTDINNQEIKTLIENINKDLDIETIDVNILKNLSYTDKNFIKELLINFKNNIIFEDIEEISDYWTIKNTG
jgi:type III secretory pathway lipoprotein EscJ